MSVTWPCVTCHVASPLSWSWLARLKCAYSRVKTMSGKIQIRTSDSQLWHNELVVNFPAASNVFIYTFQFSCWITQVIQGWHGLIIHRWKHPDVASLSLCPLVVFGTLWTGCDNIIDVITLFGVIDIGRADHMPICGTLRCQAGSIMGSVAVTTGDQSPLRGNFTITCQGTWLLAQLGRQNTRQYPPPITGHTDHEPLLVTRPSWYNKHLCQVFCCDQRGPSLSGCYCLDIRWPVLYLEPTSGSELRGNLGESWAVSVRLGGSWHGAGGAGVNTDITWYSCRCVTCHVSHGWSWDTWHVVTISQFILSEK